MKEKKKAVFKVEKKADENAEEKVEKKVEKLDDDDWLDDADLVEEKEEEIDEIDSSKLEYTKIKDLRLGMKDVNVEGVIDFVGPKQGSGYGEALFVISFIKDDTGEMKVSLWDEHARKAKEGVKIRIIKAAVTAYMGQLQLNTNRQYGVEFL